MDDSRLLLVAYRVGPDDDVHDGVALGSRVLPVTALPGRRGDLVSLCPRDATSAEALRQEVEQRMREVPDQVLDLDDLDLRPPVPGPDKIICLGLNYREHASEAGLDEPEVPILFAKFRNSLGGAHDDIQVPLVSERIDFEGELAVVIGRRGKHLTVERALEHVAGYTVMNDVTARDVQLRTSQWTAGKALDTFAPMGPGIVPSGCVPDPQDLRITTRVNDVVRQDESTALMIFGVAQTLAYVSSLMTLEPGDIVATGTPAGVGFKQEPPVFLRPGDVVEVTIQGIGTIRNPVVAETVPG